uniref:TAFII28-like protein domain-containing protein n=1 Tax=Pyramimonas obovata TaxID=1411642 RepID=A0A6T7UYC1_9CHLO|mmetsp:Transcript_16976/g.36924  ORF Transcript_16976/g.36924 Transcript_16976/m.36924 type:complete len:195 (+) Transcript_16976:242-826(+)|eukprot:CAMPEP_0118926530 /NCGR_PEP_ID=MMETSP1169-20130426/4197_1 /TAXON_ID=36882 /ORGANISM="Pyramimonas obovata, Strain CCMP722" /LENGTH=194 /DNA_ID=CAMNT_0006868097 /DNA_START=238 /DNA_END=822 /DNA_ORIENTATION=-
MTKRKISTIREEGENPDEPGAVAQPTPAKKARPSKKAAADKKAPESSGVNNKDKHLKVEEDDEDHLHSDDEEARLRKEESETEKRERMKAILARLTPDQMDRYECFRRSALQRASVKRLMQSVMQSGTVSLPMTIVMAGITKLFVGDLVEGGKAVMEERKETGPLRPVHVREAFRRISAEGKIPTKNKPRLFKR